MKAICSKTATHALDCCGKEASNLINHDMYEVGERINKDTDKNRGRLAAKTNRRYGGVQMPPVFRDNPNILCKALDGMIWPVACFDSDGRIVFTNSLFRSLTGLTSDLIASGASDIRDYLNMENAGLQDAILNIREGETRGVDGLVRPLHITPDAEDQEIDEYTNAVFFPVTFDDDGAELSGVMFLEVDILLPGQYRIYKP